jgi:hypothetical protein
MIDSTMFFVSTHNSFPAMNFICTIIINFYVLIIKSNGRFYNVFVYPQPSNQMVDSTMFFIFAGGASADECLSNIKKSV